jgi:hypothetical protein
MDPAIPFGFTAISENMPVIVMGEPVTDENNISALTIRGDRMLVQNLSPSLIVDLINGKTPARTLELLNSTYSMRQPPQIQLQPSWWPFLPLLPFRLNVILQ